MAALVAAAFVKGVLLLWLIPPFQTPDEYGHYDYALYLSHLGFDRFIRGEFARPPSLSPTAYATNEVRCLAEAAGVSSHMTDAVVPRNRPTLPLFMRQSERCGDLDPPEELAIRLSWNAVFNYPPLYHAGVAALHGLARRFGVNPAATYLLARFVSLLLFVAALWTAAATLRILRAGSWLGGSALAVMAFHPQLSMLSIAVQPDVLGLLLVTAGFLCLARAAIRPSARRLAALGAVVGLLFLAKLHLALPIAIAALALGWRAAPERAASSVARRTGSSPAAGRLVGTGIVIAVPVAVAGWYYARSWMLFRSAIGAVGGVSLPGISSSSVVNLTNWLRDQAGTGYRSYWGTWGWLDYSYPESCWPLIAAVSAAPLVFCLMSGAACVDRWRHRTVTALAADGQPVAMARLLVAASFVIFGVEMAAIAAVMGPLNNQGRHWLPFIVPQAVALAAIAAMADSAVARALAEWARRRRVALSWAAGASAASMLAAVPLVPAISIPSGYIEMEIRSNVDSRAELFVDSGAGFAPVESSAASLRQRDGLAMVRFPVVSPVVRRLRFDPFAAEGRAVVARARLLDARGHALVELPLQKMVSLDGHTRVVASDGGMAITADEGATDPRVELRLDSAVELATATSVSGVVRVFGLRLLRRWPMMARFVTLAPLWVAATFVFGLFGTLGAAAARSDRAETDAEWQRRLGLVGRAWAIGLPVFLVGLNLVLMAMTAAFYR